MSQRESNIPRPADRIGMEFLIEKTNNPGLSIAEFVRNSEIHEARTAIKLAEEKLIKLGVNPLPDQPVNRPVENELRKIDIDL